MGLDNGIEIKNLTPDTLADIIVNIPTAWVWRNDNNDIRCIETLYMRKWWGVRNQIVGYLSAKYRDDWEWKLDTEDLEYIKDIFSSWHNKERWEAEGDSIWSWEDNIPEQLEKHMNTCDKLIELQKKYPNIDICFYDSY